jgi:hypothetical protein
MNFFRAVATAFWVLAVLGSPALGTAARAQQDGGFEAVDLELVLAVDTSSSVNAAEFDLQMRGLAEAFRTPQVQAALEATGDLGVAVALIQWSEAQSQYMAVEWVKLEGRESAEAFAQAIDDAPRYLVGGGTAISGAIDYSLKILELNEFSGRRQVIDISGDGRANQGSPPGDSRDVAVDRGVTVNGLVILNEEPKLDVYYYREVIGGTAAFVLSANDFQAYADAIIDKLVKEISGVPIVEFRQPPKTRFAEITTRGNARSPVH